MFDTVGKFDTSAYFFSIFARCHYMSRYCSLNQEEACCWLGPLMKIVQNEVHQGKNCILFLESRNFFNKERSILFWKVYNIYFKIILNLIS